MFEVASVTSSSKKHAHKACASNSSYDISTVTPSVCHPFRIKMVLEPSFLESALHNGRRLSEKKCQAKEKNEQNWIKTTIEQFANGSF